jgi:hypothetical protein
MKKEEKISPLKDKPLRIPGQSIQEEMDRIFNEKIMLYIIAPFFFAYITGMTWWQKYTNEIPNPLFLTVATIIITVYCVIKISALRRKFKTLKQARDGEIAVGQYLENFRSNGARVFHDIIGENFNLDHVIVSTHGLFIIETKTYSKPKGKEAIIVYDGSSITINGYNTEQKLLTQAKSEATWLKEMLKSSTGKDFNTQTVIVFPGWFVKSDFDKSQSGVWVLNPKALPEFIGNTKETLTKEDMMLVAYHISRYIRTK